MKTENKLKIMKKLIPLFIFLSLTMSAKFLNNTPASEDKSKTNAETLYECIVKYAPIYGVPFQIAFNVARIETGYLGPYHDSYDHKQTSRAGCVGPMQLMPKYAKIYAQRELNRKVTTKDLKEDIDLNVHLSMIILNELYARHGRWDYACGAYNTGKKIINGYAKKATTQDYLVYWAKPEASDELLTAHIEYKEVSDSIFASNDLSDTTLFIPVKVTD
jgi:soluble lytic murein transglycosylase-like protein